MTADPFVDRDSPADPGRESLRSERVNASVSDTSLSGPFRVSVAGYVRKRVARRSNWAPGVCGGDTNDWRVCTARTVADTLDNNRSRPIGCPPQRNVTAGYTTSSPSTSGTRTEDPR